MLIREYGGCLSALKGNNPLSVRANYGVGILPSLFGAEYFYMPEEHQQLPNVKALGEEKVNALLDKGVPDLRNGWGGHVLQIGEYMRKIGEKYPKIGKYVWCYHPDLQGPMDVAELLCGSELFYLLADEPQWCHQLLRLITDTYHAFIGAWWEWIERKGDYSVHWGWVQKGHVMLRDDSAMNLSPDMVKEYILPYDSEILAAYGGCIHFCGKGDHYLPFYESLARLLWNEYEPAVIQRYGENLSAHHRQGNPDHRSPYGAGEDGWRKIKRQGHGAVESVILFSAGDWIGRKDGKRKTAGDIY